MMSEENYPKDSGAITAERRYVRARNRPMETAVHTTYLVSLYIILLLSCVIFGIYIGLRKPYVVADLNSCRTADSRVQSE